jgi:hypothetical protein
VQNVRLNPALLEVCWSRFVLAAFLLVCGLGFLAGEPLVGAGLLIAAVAVAVWTLRPLLAGKGDESGAATEDSSRVVENGEKQ